MNPVFYAVFTVGLALLLFPWFFGGNLRELSAERALAATQDPSLRVLELGSLIHAGQEEGKDVRPLLDRAWREMPSYKGPHPDYLWLNLALEEARAGRTDLARKALEKAGVKSHVIKLFLKGREFGPHLYQLGMAGNKGLVK